MPPYTFIESNISIDFPSQFSRICDCTGYTDLSGNFFKEMDVSYFEDSINTYYLIELKDFSLANITEPQFMRKRAWDLVKKSVDSLCFFLCTKHRYPYDINIDPFITRKPDSQTTFQLLNIIHCDPLQQPDIQLLNNLYRQIFMPYARLFNIRYYAVLEHSAAIRILNERNHFIIR